MNKKEFLKELETHERENKEKTELKKFNKIRNNIIKGSMKYNYEYSKEFYLIEPHENDMYVQN